VWFLAILLAGLLLAVFRLTTRYRFGPRSRRLVLADLAGSILAGLALAHYYLWPGAAGVYVVLGGLAVALGLFIPAALVTAELLRKKKQRVFDDKLAALQRREQELVSELERLACEVRAVLSRREQTARAERAETSGLEASRRLVERWKNEPGAARIRSIKVEEWTQEFRQLDAEGRAARRAALADELSAAEDADRRAQLEAMMAVLDLVEGSPSAGREPSDRGGGDPEGAFEELSRRKERLEADLEAARREIAEWRRRLADFLAREIELG